ncbi:MAG: hypothetical protein AAF442_00035 [Pseudomonadota bacterium]
MELSAIDYSSQALVKIGAQPINSFNDGTAESDVAGLLYEVARDGLLAVHPWSFATGQVTLPRLKAKPVADFTYAYQLPADFLRALSVGEDERGRGGVYTIKEHRIHTDMSTIILSYIFRPDEGAFPSFFVTALIARLAAEFCLPLTESSSRTEFLTKIAENELRRAKVIDSQQATPGAFTNFPLIEARA